MPSETYTQARLSRSNVSEPSFKGYMHTYYSGEGNWTVRLSLHCYNVEVEYILIFDGGMEEIYTVYSSDTTGPVLDSISVENSSVIIGCNVTVAVDAKR